MVRRVWGRCEEGGCKAGKSVPEGGLGGWMSAEEENEKVQRNEDGRVRDNLHNELTPKYFMETE